ncbi:MAG: cytochrome oxidase Cu insertion factor (SCO1/SenC/PrrC family) [Gammaproteobacteria bacterium]|jgi:cytochrome oxidase Cu insertion factor (SCO1/SenC/PrrC family)
MAKNSNIKSGNRFELMSLLVVFSSPFLVAWLIYNYTGIGKDGETINYGELIKPPWTISNTVLLDAVSGETSRPLYGKWNFLYYSTDQCSSKCQNDITKLQELRFATGDNADRIEILLLADDIATSTLPDMLANESFWTNVLILMRPDIQPIEENDYETRGSLSTMAQGIYLIDPLGNILMKYNFDSDAAGILRDLKRLLRFSRIG